MIMWAFNIYWFILLPWLIKGILKALQAKQNSVKQLTQVTCSQPSFFIYISKQFGQQLILSSYKAYLISSNLYGHFYPSWSEFLIIFY